MDRDEPCLLVLLHGSTSNTRGMLVIVCLRTVYFHSRMVLGDNLPLGSSTVVQDWLHQDVAESSWWAGGGWEE